MLTQGEKEQKIKRTQAQSQGFFEIDDQINKQDLDLLPLMK